MNTQVKNNKVLIQSLIGVAFMLLFQFVPISQTFITPLGRQVIGIFLGTVFLWSTGSMIWPSILAVVMLGFYNYQPMNQIVSNWMGNSTLVMIFFLLILVGTFTYHKGTQYVARFFLKLKIVEGRPWVFTFVILLGVYVMATFVNPWAGVFLFLPVVHSVLDELGFEKTDKYSKLMTITVVMSALLGFPTSFYNGTILALTSNYAKISEGKYHMPGGPYMVTALVLGLLSLIAITLVMRFVLRPNVEPLKSVTVEQLDRNPLPPMNTTQKIASAAIVIFILSMLLPVIFPGLPGMKFLQNNISGLAMAIVGILGAITVAGKPVMNITEIMSKQFSWATYLMIGTSLLIGSALTDKSVGFTALLQHTLTPIFQGMSVTTFTIAILVVSILITNFMNSVVYVLIVQPVILTYANVAGINPLPILMLVIFASLGTAAITPPASPYAATIFGQKEHVSPIDIYKYASIFVITEAIIILLVGVPLVNLIF